MLLHVAIAVAFYCYLLVVKGGFAVSAGPTFSQQQQYQIAVCFEGHQPTSEGSCVEQVNEAPIPGCSSSTVTANVTHCQVRVPKLKRCNPGFTLRKLTQDCIGERFVDLQYFCPTGYMDDGSECLKRSPGETRVICDGKRVGNHCVHRSEVETEKRTECPEKSSYRENRCWRVVDRFDCTEQFLCDRVCTDPVGCRHTNGHGGGGGGRAAGSFSRRGLQQVAGLIPVTAPRPSKVRIASLLCEKTAEVPAVVTTFCPPGYSKESETLCSHEEYAPLLSVCVETDAGPADSCPPKVHRVEKEARCPEGTEPSGNGKCRQEVVEPGQEYCPNQFMPADYGMCIGQLEAPLMCPAGLRLVENRCIGTRVHPPVVVDFQQPYVVAPTAGLSNPMSFFSLAKTNQRSSAKLHRPRSVMNRIKT